MSEKVRRITKDTINQPLPRKKRVIFLMGLVVITLVFGGATLWYKKQGFYLKALLSSKANDKNLIAVLCRATDCYWLNEKGIAYHNGIRFSGSLILLISDKTSRPLALGQQLIKSETLSELTFLKKRILEETGIGLRAGETQDLKLEDFDFMTNQGWLLRFSISENAYKTLAVLKQTLAQIDPQDISRLEYIDLRMPNKVYYKFR